MAEVKLAKMVAGVLGNHDPAADSVSFAGLTTSGPLAVVPITPAQITSDQDDYAGASGKGVARISADILRNISGLAAGEDGERLVLINVGLASILMLHQSLLSSAANRLILTGAVSVTLLADQSLELIYDATTGRWRQIGSVV
jgi:hypothetical protein